MKRILLVGILLALILPVAAFATDGVCIIQPNGATPECYTAQTGASKGFDGTAASCNQADFLPGITVTYVGGATNPDTLTQCQVKYCCVGQSGARVPTTTATCAGGTAPTAAQIYSSRAQAVCAQNPTNSTNGTIGTPAPPCTANVQLPAGSAACTCGSVQITTGTCCANGNAVAAGQTCPTVVDTTQCGNLQKDAGEECDSPTPATANQAATGVPCAASDKICSASCTCISKSATICGDGICGPGEQDTCLNADHTPKDCPVAPKSCTAGSAGYLAPASFTATYNDQTRAVELHWGAIPSGGCAPLGFLVGVSNTTLQAAKAKPDSIITPQLITPATTSFVDTTARQGTPIIYTLITTYDKGSANLTAQIDKPTAQCPVKDTTICLDATHAVVCNGYTPTATACTTGQTCAVFNGRARCITAAACTNCNGLFSMYPNGDETVTEGVQSGTTQIPTTCDQAITCYKDLGNTAVELYKSCSTINSCSGYETQAACETNQCQRPGTCIWHVTDAGTGKGACGATRPELIPLTCKDCNTGDGSCDAMTCQSIGTPPGSGTSLCAYVTPKDQIPPGTTLPNPDHMPALTPPDGTLGCRMSQDTPCELFTTAQACDGGKPYVLDTHYDASGAPDGGTNTITTPSADAAGHGKCVWNQGVCRKDADKNGIPDWKEYPGTADVWQSSLDFTAPTTSVFATPGLTYPADFSVPFSSTGTVYACFSLKGHPCYPSSQQDIIGQNIVHHFGLTDSGDWELRYYSIDAARNIEPVKTFSFTIDSQPPTITVGPIKNDLVRVQQTAASGAIRSRVAITFTTSEPSICSTDLRDAWDISIQSSTTTGISPWNLNKAFGSSFAVGFPFLTDGAYNLVITCTDLNGNTATKSVSIDADGDNTITGAFPVNLGNPFNVITTNIGVDTKAAAQCRYGEEGTTSLGNLALWNTFTPYTQTGGTSHRATVATPQNRRYIFTTVCNMSGDLVRGSIGDFIIFGIDNAAPSTSICNADSSDACAPVVFGNAAPTATFRLKLTCNDAPVGSPAFGCTPTGTSFCLYKEGSTPCTLTPGFVTNSITGDSVYIMRYHSIDAGGNAEDIKEQRIEPKDITPPSQPLFTVNQ